MVIETFFVYYQQMFLKTASSGDSCYLVFPADIQKVSPVILRSRKIIRWNNTIKQYFVYTRAFARGNVVMNFI